MAVKPLPRTADDASLSAPRSWISADAHAAVHCQGRAAPSPSAQPARAGQVRRSKALLKPARRVLSLRCGPARSLLSARDRPAAHRNLRPRPTRVHYAIHFQLGRCQRGSQCTATSPNPVRPDAIGAFTRAWGKSYERKVTK